VQREKPLSGETEGAVRLIGMRVWERLVAAGGFRISSELRRNFLFHRDYLHSQIWEVSFYLYPYGRGNSQQESEGNYVVAFDMHM
jgi:hypothetical protein